MKNKDLKYFWGDASLHIELGDRTPNRIKMLYWSECIFLSGMATVFCDEAISSLSSGAHWVVVVIGAFLYAFAARRLINRLTFRESIITDNYSLMIRQRSIFSTKITTYSWQYIGTLHYLGVQPKTDHPLKGKSFDYFGFEAREHLIQSIHNEGNLFFRYGDISVRFGKGLYSWDAAEMVTMMQVFAGNALRLAPEWKNLMEEMEY